MPSSKPFIVVCSFCARIKHEGEYVDITIDPDIQGVTGDVIDYSHGMCVPCAKANYPDFYKDV